MNRLQIAWRRGVGVIALVCLVSAAGAGQAQVLPGAKPGYPSPSALDPKVVTAPRAARDDAPVPRSAPRAVVRAEVLPRQSPNGQVTCLFEAAVGLRPLDTTAWTASCEQPFTIVPELP
ncbi:exported hypothetical protein [uncultured Gammaproteobacteria bacterium]